MNSVLDASAVLTYLHQEPGWETVRSVIGESSISAVNWSEVAQKIKQKGMDIVTVRSLLEELGLIIAPFSVEQAELAAHLWDQGKEFGLSMADRVCLAFAMQQQTPVFAADREWVKLQLNIDIRLLR